MQMHLSYSLVLIGEALSLMWRDVWLLMFWSKELLFYSHSFMKKKIIKLYFLCKITIILYDMKLIRLQRYCYINWLSRSQIKTPSILSKAINLFFKQCMTFHCVIAQEIKTLFIGLIMYERWALEWLFY